MLLRPAIVGVCAVVLLLRAPGEMTLQGSVYTFSASPQGAFSLALLLGIYALCLRQVPSRISEAPALVWQRAVCFFVDLFVSLAAVVYACSIVAALRESTTAGHLVLAASREASAGDVTFATLSVLSGFACLFLLLFIPPARARPSAGTVLAGIVIELEERPQPLGFYARRAVPAVFAMYLTFFSVFMPWRWFKPAPRLWYDELLHTTARRAA